MSSRSALHRVLIIALLLLPTRPAVAQSGVGALRWLDGRWNGSGGAYPSFFEEYRMVNDSTIEQYEVADSTFTRRTLNGHITRRNGRLVKLNTRGAVSSNITVSGDTVTFLNPANGRVSYRWIRTGPNTWRAELGAVTYELRRLSP